MTDPLTAPVQTALNCALDQSPFSVERLTAAAVAAVNETLGAETVTEWGVRRQSGEVWVPPLPSDASVAPKWADAQHGQPIYCQVTRYATQRTNWTTDGGTV